jgi:gamma-glutamylcyclotransferase
MAKNDCILVNVEIIKRGEERLLYYFAYGSCMDESSFAETVGKDHYQLLGRARLKGYRLAFPLYSPSRGGGGVGDVFPDPGGEMEGVLYRLKPAAWPPLDEREGVPQGTYRRMKVDVIWKGRTVRAVTYTVVNKADREFRPSPLYCRLIMNGARRHLSDAYCRRLVREWKDRFGMEWPT